MILQKLIKKFIEAIKQYNQTPSGLMSVAIDQKIKQEKIESSKILLLELEKYQKKELEIAMLYDIDELFSKEIDKVKIIRKHTLPGDYDGILETCRQVTKKTVYYYSLTGLKNIKQADVLRDPKLILENFLLDYLIEVEFKKSAQHTSKSNINWFKALFLGFGGKEASLAEDLILQVQLCLSTLDRCCQKFSKESLEYIEIVLITLNSMLYMESEKCKELQMAEPSSLRTLLLDAKKEIEKLTQENKMGETIEKDLKTRIEQAEKTVRILTGERFDQKQKEEAVVLKKKEEETKKREEDERKREALKQKIEEELKKTEEEKLNKAEEDKKKQEEDQRVQAARLRAEEEKKKEDERKKKEELEKQTKHTERKKDAKDNQPVVTTLSATMSYAQKAARSGSK